MAFVAISTKALKEHVQFFKNQKVIRDLHISLFSRFEKSDQTDFNSLLRFDESIHSSYPSYQSVAETGTRMEHKVSIIIKAIRE